MDHNCVKSCYNYRNYWGVDSVVVVGDFVVGFVVHFIDCGGRRIVGSSCYSGDYHIVGVVVVLSIAVVVDLSTISD